MTSSAIAHTLPINGNHAQGNRLSLKAKLATQKLTPQTPYHIYLSSLALKGRKAMTTLLQNSAMLLGHEGPAEHFNWQSLTFDNAHQVRSNLIELGYAVNTVNMTLAGLRGIAKTAFNQGHMNADEMQRILAIKPVKGSAKRTGRRITPGEIQQLIASTHALTDPKRSREQALVFTGIGAGLRCSELCSLSLSDVDLQTGLLTVKKGKGRKQRQIYLAESPLQAIQQWVEKRGDFLGPLFVQLKKGGGITDRGLSPSGLTHALKSLQQQANIPKFTPHDMRRTFITQLLENSVDLNTVRQLAGHSDVSTTVRYDKRDIEWQKQASQSIGF